MIDGTVTRSGAEDSQVTYEPLTHISGFINGTIYFFDGSRLEFSELVHIRAGRPIKESYRYQYIKERKAVFRYDNSRHHRKLPNFPHYKHIGRKVAGATEPTLSQVLKEVAILMVQDESE
jgi:hypothetical protein